MCQRKFGIILDGVSTKTINPKELQNHEIAKKLEGQNKVRELQIIGMKTLHRKLGEEAQNYSLIIFTPNTKMANNCIKHGIYKCAGYKQEHPAYHKHCPKRINTLEHNAIHKREDTGYFNE